MGTANDWRAAAAALARHCGKHGVEALRFEALDATSAQIVGEAFGLLSWDASLYRGKAAKRRAWRPVALQGDAKTLGALKRGIALADCTNLARTLVQTPPNIATPEFMANEAMKLADATGMKLTVLKDKQLEKERMTGLLNVGKASDHLPRFIRIEYCPKGCEKQAPVVLLGKTITYDTGGLSIKDRNGMRGMKVDKAGGCAVLGAMAAIARVHKPKTRVVGILVAAENAISDEAYRPDDVLTFRNGVTVEVTNTDAEGRLVLADGLCWACEVEKARCIVDIATLTGGVVRALGSVYAGVFANDDTLCKSVVAAGESTDEILWRLPLHPRYQDMMRSNVADIVNSNMSGLAHPVQGATFLEWFVAKGTPWAHIDMAGVGDTDRDLGALVAGPTGFGVRLMAEFASAV
jgi:leucyl aminopeptidase